MANYVPTVPEVSLATRLLTFEDAVDSVLDRFDRGAAQDNSRDMRMARRAVMDAYDALYRFSLHEWNWYRRTMSIALTAAQSDGTVAYDHTGGTYERQLTLSDSTWPTDAASGWVVISNKWYMVDDYKSSTVVTLREDSNPGADVAASTSYRWMREAYPVPPDFWKARTPLDASRSTLAACIDHVDPEAVISYNRAYTSSEADAAMYAFGSDNRVGGICLLVAPALSATRTLLIPYQSTGRPLGVYLSRKGTVSVSASGTAVTGSGTAFTSSMVGSVIRFSANAEQPTSAAGSSSGNYNPATLTRLVKSVSSSTALTLDYAAPSALTSVGYSISDPIDIDVPLMGLAFSAMVEYFFVRNDPGLNEQASSAHKWAQQETLRAMEADSRNASVSPGAAWVGNGWMMTLSDIASGVQPG